jgi:hypothetical protein
VVEVIYLTAAVFSGTYSLICIAEYVKEKIERQNERKKDRTKQQLSTDEKNINLY